MMKTVWVVAAALALHAQPAMHPWVRKALVAAYQRIDAAYSTGDARAAGMLVDAATRRVEGGVNRSFAEAVKQAGERPQPTRSVITAIEVGASNAVVHVRQQRGARVEEAVDTWANGPFGWHLAESRVVSSQQLAVFDEAAMARVRSELSKRAVAMKQDPAARPLDEFAEFGKAIADARIVFVGEAAAGSRETMLAKLRLVEYLVEAKGFTVVVTEGNWPDARAINRYINGQETAAIAALVAANRWEWFTSEGAAAVEWMKAHNALRGDGPALVFDSIGSVAPSGGARIANAYVRRYAPDAGRAVQQALGPVFQVDVSPPNRSLIPRAVQGVREVYGLLQKQRETLVAKSGDAAWSEAVQGVTVAYQALTLIATGNPESEEPFFAANLLWLATAAYPKQKIVFWTTNDHARGSSRVVREMERQLPGQSYRMGVVMGGGSVRAVKAEDSPDFTLDTHPVPAPTASGAVELIKLAQPWCYLDLRSIERESAAGKWVAAPGLFYDFGPSWTAGSAEANLKVYGLADAFDGVIVVGTTTPVTQLAR